MLRIHFTVSFYAEIIIIISLARLNLLFLYKSVPRWRLVSGSKPWDQNYIVAVSRGSGIIHKKIKKKKMKKD